MKRLLVLCFAFVLVISFVVAVSSEVSTNFEVNKSLPVANDNSNFVPAVPSLWDDYGNQVIAIVVLIVVYVLFKISRKKKAKGSPRKK
jgi:hypothetical protein